MLYLRGHVKEEMQNFVPSHNKVDKMKRLFFCVLMNEENEKLNRRIKTGFNIMAVGGLVTTILSATSNSPPVVTCIAAFMTFSSQMAAYLLANRERNLFRDGYREYKRLYEATVQQIRGIIAEEDGMPDQYREELERIQQREETIRRALEERQGNIIPLNAPPRQDGQGGQKPQP